MALKSSNKVDTNVYEIEVTVTLRCLQCLQICIYEAEKVNPNSWLP